METSNSLRHLLIRYSDVMFSAYDTIAEHASIVEKEGAVWFGKLGKTLGQVHITRINYQSKKGENSYLFLVQKHGVKYEFYKCKILRLSTEFPKAESKLIPPYYYDKDILKNISLWIKLSNINQSNYMEIDKFHILSSHSSILSTLRKSMAALFVLGEGKGFEF